MAIRSFTPLAAVFCLVGGCALGHPRVISGYNDLRGGEGYPRRDGPHRGVDIAGLVGTPVISPADGWVAIARDNRDACGNIVIIQHAFGYETVYCHLSSYAVSPGQGVKRGDLIGEIGTTGLRAGPGFEHVHWELRHLGSHEDPLLKTVGCFDPKRSYARDDDIALTYPVKC